MERWVREQVELYESSGGTQGTTLRDTGIPVVIVTMVGAKTGKVRKVPLMRVEHAGSYLLVGSKGGAPKDPVWVRNIAANSCVTVQDQTITRDMVARPLSVEERRLWWERAVAAYPKYAEYQRNTSREIPLFLAETA